MKKAIYLGVMNIHSNKSGKDFRKVDLFTPPFKDEQGFTRGGVQTYFIPLDSKIGEGIEIGALVVPEVTFDPYSNRSDLVGLKKVLNSPYKTSDFE